MHSAAATDTVSGLISSGGEKSGNPFCYSCHGATAGTKPRGDLRGFEGSAHSTGVAEPPTGTKVVCLSCHVSHSSREAALYPYTADDRCLGCHTTGVFADTKTDIAARLVRPGLRHTPRPACGRLGRDRFSLGVRQLPRAAHRLGHDAVRRSGRPVDDRRDVGGRRRTVPEVPRRGLCRRASRHLRAGLRRRSAAGGATYTVNIASSWETTSVHGAGASVEPEPARGHGLLGGRHARLRQLPRLPRLAQPLHAARRRCAPRPERRPLMRVLVVPVGATGADFRFFCASCHDLTAANHPGPGRGRRRPHRVPARLHRSAVTRTPETGCDAGRAREASRPEAVGSTPRRDERVRSALSDRRIACFSRVLIVLVVVLMRTHRRASGRARHVARRVRLRVSVPRPVLAIPGPGKGDAPEFARPLAAAWAPNGDIYVSDTGNGRICVFTGAGRFVREFGRAKPPKDADCDRTCCSSRPAWRSALTATSMSPTFARARSWCSARAGAHQAHPPAHEARQSAAPTVGPHRRRRVR